MFAEIGNSRYEITEKETDTFLRTAKTAERIAFFYNGKEGFDKNSTSGELRGDFDVLKRLLADRAGNTAVELDCDGAKVLLVFPAYLYDFIEDTRARAIHHKIEGSGYVYRECVWRRTIRIREYDSLFIRAMDESVVLACDVALGRLLAPFDLAPGHKDRYERFLEQNAAVVLFHVLNLEKGDGIGFKVFPWDAMEALYLLTERMLLDHESVKLVLGVCKDNRLAEAAALLLRYEKEHWGRQRGQRMVLEEF